jgi:hypothetical protein
MDANYAKGKGGDCLKNLESAIGKDDVDDLVNACKRLSVQQKVDDLPSECQPNESFMPVEYMHTWDGMPEMTGEAMGVL